MGGTYCCGARKCDLVFDSKITVIFFAANTPATRRGARCERTNRTRPGHARPRQIPPRQSSRVDDRLHSLLSSRALSRRRARRLARGRLWRGVEVRLHRLGVVVAKGDAVGEGDAAPVVAAHPEAGQLRLGGLPVLVVVPGLIWLISELRLDALLVLVVAPVLLRLARDHCLELVPILAIHLEART